MQLTNLKIENFGSIGKISLPLNKPGLILVTGVNKDAPNADSNGSGKSLLFESLCWCLWGETVRGLSSDEVVNTATGKDCCVSLTIEEHGSTYVVSRHRLDTRAKKPNDLVVSKDGMLLSTSGKVKTMQEVVNQLVGFDFDTFRAMMPGAGIKVASLTDKAIKELLESLLQTDQLAQAYETARGKLKTLEGDILKHTTQLLALNAKLTGDSADVGNLRTVKLQLEESLRQRRAAHTARISSLQAEISEADIQLAQEQELTNAHFDYRTKANRIEQDILLESLEPLKTALAAKDALIQQASWDEAFARKQIGMTNAAIEQANNLGATCDSCHQQVPVVHTQAVIGKLQADLDSHKKNLISATNLISSLKAQKRDLEREEMTVVEEKRRAVKQLREAEEAVKAKIDALKSVKMLRERAIADLVREKASLDSIRTDSRDFDSLIAEKEAAIQTTKENIAKQEGVIATLEAEVKLCSFWVEGFSPAGLRSFMLDYVTPILNDRAKYYADLLTHGEMSVSFSTKTALKSGQEKDKFTITCQQAHGATSYRGASAGERARADLVIAMALGDLAQFRTAKQLPWRFLDEPFESIDRSGTEAIVRLLNDQKARYNTVFVVTHKPDFKELFSQQVTVVKENGVSSLLEE
jgi:DNA repair exonuclease SbcCD ATPase subunit